MYGEAKKLHLLEALLKEDNEAVLAEVETILIKSKLQAADRKGLKDFAGIWTKEEAEEIEKIIEESCEQINPDDWK
jgi:hypothetical protein